MAWWKNWSVKQSRTAGLPRRALSWWSPMPERMARRSYAALASDGYVRNPVVRRAVQIIADAFASLPLNVTIDGQALDPQHPASALLHAPAPGCSGGHLREALATYLLLHGNAYVELVEGADGVPEELHSLRPERVTLVPGRDGWPAGYRYTLDGQWVSFDVDPVTGRSALLHLKNFHPLDDHYGAGQLEAAETAIETYNAAARWSLALLDNAARPSGALVYDHGDGALSPDQFERLKADMAEHFSGSANAGRPLLLEGGLKWQALSLSPADMDFINGKHASARDIALAFGVPPLLLNIPGDATYANYQEAGRTLYRLTVLPLAARVCDALAAWLATYWPGLRICVDSDRVPALARDRELLWRQIAQAAFLSDAERRQLLGLGDGEPPLEP
jgi:HK97 family phage portal protein